MNKAFKLVSLAFFTAFVMTLNGCKKNIETSTLNLTTLSVSEITKTTAATGGIVIFNGSEQVTARGVCWSTLQDPTIADNRTTDGVGTGSFNSSLTGLNPDTDYYVRAYAFNGIDVAYGIQRLFRTQSDAPVDPSSGYWDY